MNGLNLLQPKLCRCVQHNHHESLGIPTRDTLLDYVTSTNIVWAENLANLLAKYWCCWPVFSCCCPSNRANSSVNTFLACKLNDDGGQLGKPTIPTISNEYINE